MSVKVDLKPISVIKAKMGIQKNGPVQSYFSETCYKYMTSFVPGGVKSHLNQTALVMPNYIEYQGPAAHYLYNGILYVDPETGSSYARKGVTKIPTSTNLKYHTPGTGAHWDKRMWNSKGEKVVEEIQKYVDRGCMQ